MGSLLSKSYSQSVRVDGNNNQVWVIDGTKFNVSSTIDQISMRISNAVKNSVIVSNRLVINTPLLLAIILTCLAFFMYKKYHNSKRLKAMPKHHVCVIAVISTD